MFWISQTFLNLSKFLETIINIYLYFIVSLMIYIWYHKHLYFYMYFSQTELFLTCREVRIAIFFRMEEVIRNSIFDIDIFVDICC